MWITLDELLDPAFSSGAMLELRQNTRSHLASASVRGRVSMFALFKYSLNEEFFSDW